jgi:hypothetical protein
VQKALFALSSDLDWQSRGVIASYLGLIARTDSAMFFWFRLEKKLVLPIVTAQFCFALEYARADAGWSRRAWGWLIVPPFLFAALIWTNQAHHLVWPHVWVDCAIQVKLGPGHWIAIVYALILSLGRAHAGSVLSRPPVRTESDHRVHRRYFLLRPLHVPGLPPWQHP